MKLEVSNCWARIVEASPDELDWLYAFFSSEENKFSPHRGLDGRWHAFNLIERVLPAGLVSLLTPRVVSAAGFSLEVVRTPTPPGFLPLPPDERDKALSWLRPYQREAIEAAIARDVRGLIKVPTGGGKSEVFIGLTRTFPGVEWLFLVHRGSLVEQTAARYELRTKERAGRFSQGKWERGTCNVTVSTFQSIASALKKKTPDVEDLLEEIGGLNVDEVHAQPADSFFAVSQLFTQARFRIGQSGTPLDRSGRDTLRTIGALGPLVYSMKTQVLMEAGVLSPSVIRMVPHRHTSQQGNAPWVVAYTHGIVKNDGRNKLIAAMARAAQKPALLFVDELEHAKRISDCLKGLKISHDIATGQTLLTRREDLLDSLVKGKIDVLICTVIFQEGIDVPTLRSVIVGGGGKSVVAVNQRTGRGMRKAAGKDYFELWDVLDTHHKWFARHAIQRKAAYEREGHTVTLTDSSGVPCEGSQSQGIG